MVSLMGVMMLAALETTIVGPAMPTIGRELGNAELLPWIVTSYLLVSTSLTPLYGKLADIRGRRVVIIFAATTFLIGSFLCAISSSMLMLIIARGLQGIGGGGIFAMTQTIIGDIVAPRERAKYQIYTSTVWLIANMLGPVMGGYFAEYMHWTMIFWINLPLGIIALAFVGPKLKRLPRNERPHRLDIIGSLLIMAASAILMLALSWGGTRFAWLSWQIGSLFAVSLIAWALLVLRQMTAAEPLIPVSVLSNQIVRMATTGTMFSLGVYVGLIIYLPVYLQTVSGLSVSASGLAIIPLLAFTSLGATIGAKTMKYSWRRMVPLGGTAAAAISAAGMALLSGMMPLWLLIFFTIVISTGMGCVFPLVAVSLQSAVARHELGTTMSLLVFLRSLGSAIGVAVFGAILFAVAGVEAVENAGRHSAAQLGAIADAFAWISWGVAGGYVAGFILLARMEKRPLEGFDT